MTWNWEGKKWAEETGIRKQVKVKTREEGRLMKGGKVGRSRKEEQVGIMNENRRLEQRRGN